MFDPWKKSPSNTLHTALSKKIPIPPLSFWRERHCSASECLEKEEPGHRRQPWWLADRFAAQNCSRVHGQTLLYFKFSNVKMTTRVRVDFIEGVFFFFLFFFLSLCDHTTVFPNESGCTVQTARQQRVNKALERTCGTSQRQHDLLLLFLPLLSLLCLLFHSVRNNISRYIHGYSGNSRRMVCKLTVGRSRSKKVAGESAGRKCSYLCASPGTKWWNISSLSSKIIV